MGNCLTKENNVSLSSRPNKAGKYKEDIIISKKTNIMNSTDFDDDKGVNDVNEVRKKIVRFPRYSNTYLTYYDDPRKYEEKTDIWCTALELQQYTDDIRVVLIKAAEKEKQMELKYQNSSKGIIDHRDDEDDDESEEEENCCLRGLEEFYEDGMFSSEELRHHHMQSILKIQRYETRLMAMKKRNTTIDDFIASTDDFSMNSSIRSVSTARGDLEKKNQLLHAVIAKIGKIESSRAVKRAKQDQLDANDYHYNTNLAHIDKKNKNGKNRKKKHTDPALSDNYSKNTIAHNTTSSQPPQRNAAAARSA